MRSFLGNWKPGIEAWMNVKNSPAHKIFSVKLVIRSVWFINKTIFFLKWHKFIFFNNQFGTIRDSSTHLSTQLFQFAFKQCPCVLVVNWFWIQDFFQGINHFYFFLINEIMTAYWATEQSNTKSFFKGFCLFT